MRIGHAIQEKLYLPRKCVVLKYQEKHINEQIHAFE